MSVLASGFAIVVADARLDRELMIREIEIDIPNPVAADTKFLFLALVS